MSNDKVFYVYEWIRLDTNEPFYVGKGKGDRWRCKQRSEWFLHIMKKTDVAVCIIADELTEQEAFEVEAYCIWYYRDVLGYELVNFTDGGEGTSGYKHSEESKSLMSAAIKINHKGMSGKKQSYETRLKISEARKGWNPSEETREKMRNNCIRLKSHERLSPFEKGNIPWNKGRAWTDEEKLKLSQAHIGKTLPDEQKEKIRVSTQKTYDNMLKERFPIDYYHAIKNGLNANKLKKDICEELSITMHNLRRIIEVYERD